MTSMPAHTGAIFRAASCSMRLPGADLSVGPRDFSAYFRSCPVRSRGSRRLANRNSWVGTIWLANWRCCRLPQAGRRNHGGCSRFRSKPTRWSPRTCCCSASCSVCAFDRMESRRDQELRKRLIRDVADREDPVAELANAALAQIVGFLGAAQGRLVTGVGAADTTEGAERTRTMAEAAVNGQRADPDAGAGPVADDSAPFDDGVFGRQPGSRDYRSHGTEAADFSISHASLLESSIGVLRTWLRECSMAPRRKRSKWNCLRRLKRASTTSSHARRRRPGKPADRSTWRQACRDATHECDRTCPVRRASAAGDRCPGTIEDWRDLRASSDTTAEGTQLHRNETAAATRSARAPARFAGREGRCDHVRRR